MTYVVTLKKEQSICPDRGESPIALTGIKDHPVSSGQKRRRIERFDVPKKFRMGRPIGSFINSITYQIIAGMYLHRNLRSIGLNGGNC
jgi:hypothetical protein